MNINLEKLRRRRVKIVGHKNADFDSMTSGIILKYIFDKCGINSEYVLQDPKTDARFLEIAQKYNIDVSNIKTGLTNGDDIFLVDHTGRYPYNNVLGCIDHHPPVVNMQDNYVYRKQTSCGKIISDFADELNIKLPDELKTLVVYSCYLDSLSFTSTKSVQSDLEWCQQQIAELGLNEDEIIEFGYGLTDLSNGPEEFALNSKKSYPFGKNQKIKASYNILKDINEVDLDVIDNILRKELSLKTIAWCYILHDIINKNTIVMLIQDDGTDVVCVDGLPSRGEKIVPCVIDALEDCKDLHIEGEYFGDFVPAGSSIYDIFPNPEFDNFLDNIPEEIIDSSKFPASKFLMDAEFDIEL